MRGRDRFDRFLMSGSSQELSKKVAGTMYQRAVKLSGNKIPCFN